MSNIGIMNDAYFVPAKKLVDWINEILQMNISKVEQCANGAIYAQLLDVLYPKTMNLSKINFAASSYPEFLNNYKVIQQVLEKNNEAKIIPVERLVKGKYQDNLEFLQWIHNYFMQRYNGLPYDAAERRSKSKGGNSEFLSQPGKENDVADKPKSKAPVPAMKPKKTALAPSKPSTSSEPSASTPMPTTTAMKSRPSENPRPVPRATSKSVTVGKEAEHKGEYRSGKASPLSDRARTLLFRTSTFDDVDSPELSEGKKKAAELEQEVRQMRETNQDLSNERNFYYEKILKVEDLVTGMIASTGENVEDFQREAQETSPLPPVTGDLSDKAKMAIMWKGILRALYSADNKS